MMRNTIATLFALVTLCPIGVLMGQGQDRCGTMANYHHQVQDPEVAARYAAVRQAAAQWRSQQPMARITADSLLTIPVVVHVLYKNPTQNISDAQIASQIRILNEDYRRLNADTVNTPAVFDSIAADIQVEFCLASLDPSGQPTTGITRTSTTGGQFFGYFQPLSEDAKYDSTGGHDAWPADQYLNIWVCELFPGLLGYAQFPGGAAATDGVVITYTAFGDMGTVAAPSLFGQTTTHEVGHWMGLYHIWGDDQDCSGSDSIYDTPNVTVASSSDCQVGRNSCSNEDPYWGSFDVEDMVQNYMDYSHDSCMNMFTEGQKVRMHSFLNADPMRMALFSSPAGCNTAVVGNVEASHIGFSVHPNPSNGLVTLDVGEGWEKAEGWQVLDMQGRMVLAGSVDAREELLELSALLKGMYLVRVMGEGFQSVQRLLLL